METGKFPILAEQTITDLAGAVVGALQGVLGGPATLHEPCLQGEEWTYVKECLDTGWVSSVGKFVDQFENDLARFTNTEHAIATVNGTAALHACLVLAGVKRDDEVIVPALTFVATANAVCYLNAIPHFADSEARTLGLDPVKLEAHLQSSAKMKNGVCINSETGRVIRAVICMHTFGHPVDMDPLLALCQKWNLFLIEDAAESLGTTYKGIQTGNFGRLAALSFNGNKTITTGGGGAILTNEADLAKKAKHLTTTAKVPHAWDFVHDQVAFNYRMPNVNAAIGVAQLEQLPGFLANKRRLADTYAEAFANIDGLAFFWEPNFAHSNYWLNLILLDQENSDQLETVLRAVNDAGYMSRPAWVPMHQLDIFAGCPAMDLSITEDLARRLINIPSSSKLV
jgi:perosamine synthetase